MARSFVCVHVPCDISKQCAERTIVIPDGEHAEVSCLMDDLKKHFSAQGGFRDDAHREEYLKSIESQLPAAPEGASTEEMAEQRAMATSRLMSMQLIDCVIMLPNCKQGKWELICLYVDDKGAAKGMPTNERATQICCSVGLPQYTTGGNRIAGDAFIARSVDDNADLYGRRDFRLTEMGSASKWFKTAKRINAAAAARRETTGFNRGVGNAGAGAGALKALTGGGGAAAAPKDPFADTPAAERWERAADAKRKGNEAFKAQSFRAAVAAYRMASLLLERCPTRVGEEADPSAAQRDAEGAPRMEAVLELSLAVNLNCAAAELKLGEFAAAQRSASVSLAVCDRIDSTSGWGGAGDDAEAAKAQAVKQRVKALFRRGAARMRAGQIKSARGDLLKAARLAPQDRAVRALYNEAKEAQAAKVAESKRRRQEAWSGGQGLFAGDAAASGAGAGPRVVELPASEGGPPLEQSEIREEEPMTEDGSMSSGALRPDLDGFGMHVRPMTADAVKAMVDSEGDVPGEGDTDITPQ